MSQNIGYLNLYVDGSLPTVFNPATFKTTAIQSDQVATQTLTVSSQTNTNGIIDYNSIDAHKLNVNNEAVFNGSLIPNSSCIATTFYVDDKINTIMGGGNINTLLDSISEINTALNNDPNYSNTVGLRLGQNEVNIQNNANAIVQLDNDVETINTTLLDHDSRLVIDRTDIDDINTTLNTVQSNITTNTNNITTNTNNIATINNTLTNTIEPSITSNTNNITTNTNNITTINNTLTNTIQPSLTTINSTLATKANSSNPTFTGTATFNTIISQAITDNGNIAIKGNTIIGDQTTDTLTINGNAKFNNNLVLSDNTNALTRLNNNDSSISTINSSITTINNTLSTKANDNSVVHLSNNESISGIKTFNDIPKIGLNTVATTSDISTAINNLINSAPGTLDTLGEIATQLQTDQNSINTIVSSMITLTGTQTISGLKTFSTSPSVPTLTQGDNSTSIASTSYVDSGLTNITNNYLSNTTASSTYQPISSMSSYLTTASASSTYQPISSMSSYLTTASATSTYQPISSMSSYLTTASASSTYQTIANMTNYLTTASASSTYQTIANMTNYLTTSTASATYQTISGMSSYGALSGANTWTNTNEYSSEFITNKMVEKFITATVSTNALAIVYSSTASNVYAISPSSATNITLSITSLPTTRNAIYNFTFLINVGTYEKWIGTLNVNGAGVVMKAMGGLANITVDASASFAIQNIYIQMTGATPTNAFTSVSSAF